MRARHVAVVVAAFCGALVLGVGAQQYFPPPATSVSGNAATATALQTARAINGVAFDGTADVAVPPGPVSGQTIGDGLYADSTTTWARRAAVATGSVLISGGVGVAPLWSATPTLTSWTTSAANTVNRAAIGTTSTTGTDNTNPTAAAAGAQQYSPRTCWTGQGWKTTATAASQSTTFCIEVQPAQGTTAPSALLTFSYSVNGGAFSNVLTINNSGSGTYAGNGAICSTCAYLSGQNIVISGATPTVTSGFGAGPTVAGKASMFRVTVGTGGDTTGVVAFNATFTNPPACSATNETTGNLARTNATTTGVTINAVMVAADKISVLCLGY